MIFCVVPGGGESNSAGTGIAGQNFFENHLSPVRDLGTIDGKTVTFFHEVTTSPTWDATVTEVPTHLGLDGEVKLFTTAAFVNFSMTGRLGGPALTINLTVGPFPNCPCSIFLNEDRFGKQAPETTAVETLTVEIFGRARYDAEGSPVFEGAVPEPGTWLTVGSGFLVMVGGCSRSFSSRLQRLIRA